MDDKEALFNEDMKRQAKPYIVFMEDVKNKVLALEVFGSMDIYDFLVAAYAFRSIGETMDNTLKELIGEDKFRKIIEERNGDKG